MIDTLEKPNALNHEKDRLAKLYGYNILNDYSKIGAFQHVVGMAAHIFKVPIAVVNFVDENKVLTKSSVGVDNLTEVDRGLAICSQAILQQHVTVFKNAKLDPCLLTNPFVHGEFGLQFYAAAPLRTADGFNIGVLAIVDKKPREFTKQDEQLLEGLAAIVMEDLEEKRISLSRFTDCQLSS